MYAGSYPGRHHTPTCTHRPAVICEYATICILGKRLRSRQHILRAAPVRMDSWRHAGWGRGRLGTVSPSGPGPHCRRAETKDFQELPKLETRLNMQHSVDVGVALRPVVLL